MNTLLTSEPFVDTYLKRSSEMITFNRLKDHRSIRAWWVFSNGNHMEKKPDVLEEVVGRYVSSDSLIFLVFYQCFYFFISGTLTKPLHLIITDLEVLYHSVYLLFCALGLFCHPFFYSVLLFDVVYREETLLNVIRSVTRNGRSILLTAVLALILVYMFSIIGYMFFRDDFLLDVDAEIEQPAETETDGGQKERACDSLIMCIVTTLNQVHTN